MGGMLTLNNATGVATPLDERSLYLRHLVMEALIHGGRGHVGSALSLIEIFRVLYDDVLSFRADEPSWPDRDRCILSKGHGCLALYAILADHGFFERDILKTFCHHDSPLGGHPEFGRVPGVEASTGALGHGMSIGLGLAVAARMQKRPSRVFVVTGDGELNEGSIWEACLAAAKHKLANLIAIVDYNKLQSYGPVSTVLELEPLGAKFSSFGFSVVEIDGHDVQALQRCLTELDYDGDQPHAVICHTVKGKGIPEAEFNASWHHKSRFQEQELELIREALGGAHA